MDPPDAPTAFNRKKPYSISWTTVLLPTNSGRKPAFDVKKGAKFSGDLINKVRNWQQNPYKGGLLNRLWQIIPGLLLWTIWKERNKCIFKDQCTPLDTILSNLCLNIQETMALQSWQVEDFPNLPREKAIWENWNIQIPQF